MHKTKITIFLAVILITLFGVVGVASAATSISSLPFNANQAGETYVLGSDLSLDSGNAITVSANNIVLNGNGKTITFATTGPGNAIHINSNVTSLEVYGFALTHGGYTPGTSETVHGIYRNGQISGANIHDNTITIVATGSSSGAYGRGIYFTSISNQSINNHIYSNVISVTGAGFGHGISLQASTAGSISGTVHDNTITLNGLSLGYPAGISLGNRTGVLDIYSNSINIASNCLLAQGIALWASDNNTIRLNTINLAGENSRAILIDGGSDANAIHSNVINLTSVNTADRHSAGIRVRYGSQNNDVYSNNITASPGSNACFPIRHGGNQVGTSEPMYGILLSGNKYHNNTLTGGSSPIYLEGGSLNTQFYNNVINNTGGGYAISVYGTNAEYSDNVSFSYETINTNKSIRFSSLTGQTSAANVVFCSSGLTTGNISVLGTNVTAGWSITEPPCPAGSNPEADTTPPSAPTGLAVN